MIKILVTDKIHDGGVKKLKEFAEVDVATGLKPAELLERIPGYDAIVVRSATKVTSEVIEAGKRLKVIARAGVGLDNIDVGTANAKGIKVVNAPEATTIAVAELVFALMLAWVRHVPRADTGMKQGRWEKKQLAGSELLGKTLGVIGTGRIGREVCLRAKVFGMTLLAYDAVPNREFAERASVKYVDLDTLLRESDFVSLHVPLMSQTEHMISGRELGLMKSTAVLVNTSRGKIIDEAALVEALKQGEIAGACLDVYEHEPPKQNPLLKLPNVALTPHLGASTAEAQRSAALIVAQKIKEELAIVS